MGGELTQKFDYGGLPEPEERAFERHASNVLSKLGQLSRHTVETVADVGKELEAAQERWAHRGNGKFGAWVKGRCGISRSAAYRYIDSWRVVKDCPTVGQSLDLSSVYLIAPQKCPAPARAEVLKLAESGKVVTKDQTKAIVEKYKPPKEERGGGGNVKAPETGTVIEATATTVSDDAPTAASLIQALAPVNTRVRKVAEALNGEAFDAKAAGGHITCVLALLEGETPRFVLADPKELAAKASGVKASDVAMPPALDTPECRKALDEWIDHKRLRKPAYRSAAQVQKVVDKFASLGAAEFVKAVNHSIGANYAGLFPESGGGNGGKPAYRPGPGERFDPKAKLGSL